MIVCICNNVNVKTIENALDKKSLKSIGELQEEMNICNQCKCCAEQIQDIIYCADLRRMD